MLLERYPETDPDEIEAARRIVALVDVARDKERTLRRSRRPVPGSDLDRDRLKMPRLPTENRIYGQLSTAFGCLTGVGALFSVEETDTQFSVVAGPYGCYSLLRNALDCAALALWLLTAPTQKQRLRRELHAQLDEIHKWEQYLTALGQVPGLEHKRRNLATFAQQIGIRDWSPQGNSKKAGGKKTPDKLPPTSKILTEIERFNFHKEAGQKDWLASWQLCSGFTHGKLWAATEAHAMIEQIGTRHTYGATFFTTVSFQNFYDEFLNTFNMCLTGMEYYSTLATQQSTEGL